MLPRKEVIQPQLPLRLPCSRGSPCRHEAWTISSSWSLEAPKTGLQQTALPWMPRPHAVHEVPLRGSHNIEPTDRMICSAARTVQLPTGNPLMLEDCLQLGDICSVLLNELDVEPRGG